MGEYATRLSDMEEIKIGTCEDLYYLRADQIDQVSYSGNLRNPVFRFRFPLPSEDDVSPGDFEDYDKGFTLYGLTAPDGVDHYSVQFSASNGYLVSLPCPESDDRQLEAMGCTMHRNGYGGAVKITQQRVWDGKLVVVGDCKGCGAKWRYETLEMAGDLLAAIDAKVAEERNEYNRFGSEHTALNWEEIGRRVRAGYVSPPAWVAATAVELAS